MSNTKGFFAQINNGLDKLFNSINTNKYIFGFVMIVMNIGSRYLATDLSAPFHKALFSSRFARRLVIFCIMFVATRDIKVSLISTVIFVILMLNLFDDRSDYCILPKNLKNLDTNMDGEISSDEIERAYKILQKTGKLSKNDEKIKKQKIKEKERNKKNIMINIPSYNNTSTYVPNMGFV